MISIGGGFEKVKVRLDQAKKKEDSATIGARRVG